MRENHLKILSEIHPRLKYSVPFSVMYDWLDNFDTEDRADLLELLFFFEYYSENDIIQVLSEQLKILGKKIHKLRSSKVESDVIFVPILPDGKEHKSGSLLKYYIGKTTYFTHLQKSFPKRKIEVVNDIRQIDYKRNTCLIFIDDFSGSGDTVIKFIKSQKLLDRRRVLHVDYLCIAYMSNAKKNFFNEFSNDINLYGIEKVKIFDDNSSPFANVSQKVRIKGLVEKYRNKFKKGSFGYDYAFGYKDSQSMLSFAHGCPNNSLSIFWYNEEVKKNGLNWNPLYPRISSKRIEYAKELKKSVAYWIGLLNRLKYTITEDFEIEGLTERRTSEEKLGNIREDFIVLAVMKLLAQNYGLGVTSQITGLTPIELEEKLKKMKNLKLLLNNNEVSTKGHKILADMDNLTHIKKKELYRNQYKIMHKEEYIYSGVSVGRLD